MSQNSGWLAVHHTYRLLLTLTTLFIEDLTCLTGLLQLFMANTIAHILHHVVRWTHLSALRLHYTATFVDSVKCEWCFTLFHLGALTSALFLIQSESLVRIASNRAWFLGTLAAFRIPNHSIFAKLGKLRAHARAIISVLNEVWIRTFAALLRKFLFARARFLVKSEIH